MSKSLQFTLFLLSIADAIVFHFGDFMLGFAGEGLASGAPLPLGSWLIILIPLLAVLAPVLARWGPWPLITPLRRAAVCALPMLYVATLWLVASASA